MIRIISWWRNKRNNVTREETTNKEKWQNSFKSCWRKKNHSKVIKSNVIKAHSQMTKKMFQIFWLKKKLINSKLLKEFDIIFFLEDHILYFERATYTFINLLPILCKDFWNFRGEPWPFHLTRWFRHRFHPTSLIAQTHD